MISFWASWCSYCRKELPALNQIQAQAGDSFLKVVAVNVKDETSDYRAMTRQMRDYALTLTRDRDGSIAEGYGVESYPNLWIIDPQGRVASRHNGYGDDSFGEIVGEIRRVLYEAAGKAQDQAAGADATAGAGAGSQG